MTTPKTDRDGVTQALRALDDAGWHPVAVTSPGEDREPTPTVELAVNEVMALDDAYVVVSNGERESWVRFVLGNDPDEVVCDYLTSLSPVLDGLIDAWIA